MFPHITREQVKYVCDCLKKQHKKMTHGLMDHGAYAYYADGPGAHMVHGIVNMLHE
jgi:hypothetical protein